jgi:hypothetical protein
MIPKSSRSELKSMTWFMRGGTLNVGLLRTNKKVKKFGGSCKHIREFENISKFLVVNLK